MTATFSVIRARGVAADALQVAHEVAALPVPVMRELLPLLHQAEIETASALRQWLASAPGQGERFTAYQMSRVLIQLRGAMDTLRRIDPALVRALGQGASRAGVLSAQHLTGIISRNSARFGTHLEAPIRLDLARVIATGQGLIPRFKASAARYGESVQAEIRQQLAIGVLRNESYQGLIQRLAGRSRISHAAGVEPDPSDAARGLLRGADWRLERLARTEMAHASEVQAHQAFLQARAQMPDLRRIWNSALDMRVCRTCAEMNGVVSDATGAFPGDVVPPLHPQCRCCATVWRESWGEIDLAA